MKLTTSVEPLIIIENGEKTQQLDDNHDPLFTVTSTVMDGLACVFESTQNVAEHNIGIAMFDGVMNYEQLSAIDIIPAHFDIGEMLNDLDADENAAIVGSVTPDECSRCGLIDPSVLDRLVDPKYQATVLLCPSCNDARMG